MKKKKKGDEKLGKGKLTLRIDRCKGCELCVLVCPEKILQIDQDTVNIKDYHPIMCIDMSRCIGCGNCATMCPDGVINVYREEEAAK